MAIEDTRTECPHGHPFDETNNYKNKDGYYRCRICNKLRMRITNSTPEAKAKNVTRVRKWVEENREHYRKYCRERRAKTVQWIQEQKQRGCLLCGETTIACLDFHHRDPKTKSFCIGLESGAVSLKRVIREVAKCDILCANCHRKLHAAEKAALGE